MGQVTGQYMIKGRRSGSICRHSFQNFTSNNFNFTLILIHGAINNIFHNNGTNSIQVYQMRPINAIKLVEDAP